MELQTTITIISVLTGAITIITYIRKNENRITILEGKVNDKLDIIVKELDVLMNIISNNSINNLTDVNKAQHILSYLENKINNFDALNITPPNTALAPSTAGPGEGG